MTQDFSELKYNPICPKCESQLDLFDESTHQFEFDNNKWEEIHEEVNNEYLECPTCAFYISDGELI